MSILGFLELILLFVFFLKVARNLQIKMFECDNEELRKYLRWSFIPCLKAPIFILLLCSPLAVIYSKCVMLPIPIFVFMGTFDLYRKDRKFIYAFMMFLCILFGLLGLAPI